MNEQRPAALRARFFAAPLAETDPELAAAIGAELHRQQDGIELIASENIVSAAVLEAQGSVLTNKYAEGYPGRRYYGGCVHVDVAETLAIDRAKKLFGCSFANVQPHSGAQANQAVFLALLQPGDTILGMSLAAGGHLTHGAAPNLSGKWFHAVQYGVRREDGLLDYEETGAPGARGTAEADHRRRVGLSALHRFPPHPQGGGRGGRVFHGRHGAFRRAGGGRAVPLPAAARACRDDDDAQDAARAARRHGPVERPGDRQEDQLRRVPRPAGRPADACHRRQGGGVRRGAAAGIPGLPEGGADNARVLAETLKDRGLDIVSGGTDSHLMLVDLRPKRVTGKAAEASLERAHMTANKNAIPFDPEKPAITSGIRLGSPAATTRGFGTAEFREIGLMINEVLEALGRSNDGTNAAVEQAVGARVKDMCARFPLYPAR